jgi:hypothetical protein
VSKKKLPDGLDLSNLPPPSDNLGPNRRNYRKRKPAPVLRKPREDEEAPENLADAITQFMAQMTEQPSALSDWSPVIEDLPDPPAEDATG